MRWPEQIAVEDVIGLNKGQKLLDGNKNILHSGIGAIMKWLHRYGNEESKMILEVAWAVSFS